MNKRLVDCVSTKINWHNNQRLIRECRAIDKVGWNRLIFRSLGLVSGTFFIFINLTMNKSVTLEKITSLAKRRGFVFPASDLYGGLANTWDYGPYGTALKENLRKLWWNFFIDSRDNIFGIDSSIILKSEIWEASGHTSSFSDALIDCKNCKTELEQII